MVIASFTRKLPRAAGTLEFLLAILLLAAGCGNKPNKGQAPNVNASLKRSYTRTELDKLIRPGMSLAEITNTFGPPQSMIPSGEHTSVVSFLFPIDLSKRMNEETMVGFDIQVKDGTAKLWSPITAGPEQGGTQPSSSPNQKSMRFFSLFVASDTLRNLLETLDTGGQPDMTGMRIEPNLTFSAEVFLDDRNDRPWSDQVALVLNPADEVRLKRLTETNIGKRVVIVCSNKVVAAPMIDDPINRSPLLLRVKGTNALNTLRGN